MKKSILFLLFAAVAKIANDYSKNQAFLLKSVFILCTATLLFSCTANDEPISEETSFLNQIKTSFNPNTFTDFGGGENWDIDWNNFTELTKDSTQIYTFALKAKNETKIQSDLFQEKVVHQIIGFKKGQKALTYLLEVKSNIESSLYTNDITHLGNFNGIASVYTFKKELLGTITFGSGKANNYSQNKELDALTAVFNLYYVPKLNSKIPACRATTMIYDLRYQDIYVYTYYNGVTSDITFRERKLISVTSYSTTVIYPCDSPTNTDERYIPHITPVYLKVGYIDSSGLIGKAKCLNDLLKGNSYVKNLLNNFQGNSEFNINIVSKDNLYNNGKEVNGLTFPPSNNAILIQISSSRTNSNSTLDAARTILHEYIHADIWRKLLTTNQNDVAAADFKKLYELYGLQHGAMAGLYLQSMKEALKDFHKNILPDDYKGYINYYGEEPSDAFYEALAWSGLQEEGVKDWANLPQEEKERITNLGNRVNGFSRNAPCP